MDNIGTCKLCLEEGVKLRNSHIIPKFNYKPFHDEKRRFIRISTTDQKTKKFLQDGFKERMLCQACETKFSKWEKYADRLLYKGLSVKPSKFEYGYIFSGVDYSRLKLYLLSILWRMSASGHKMFSQVNLGKHHHEIRATLLAEDPLKENRYPVFLKAVTHNGKLLSNSIMRPSLNRYGGVHYYRVLMDGLLYVFCVGSHRILPELDCFCLRQDGVLTIPVMPLREIEFLWQDLLEIRNAMRQAENAASPA